VQSKEPGEKMRQLATDIVAAQEKGGEEVIAGI